MSFKVEPSALRAYASQLDEVERVGDDAQRYVGTYGNFSFHQSGIIGFAAPGHRNLMGKLHELLAHLIELGTNSQTALRSTSDVYFRTDEKSAAKIDAIYPPTPRPRPDMDETPVDPWHE